MESKKYNIGMIGLGVMGRNLLLNMAEHGFPVAGYDRGPQKVAALLEEGKAWDIFGTSDLRQFLEALRKPRLVMMLVTAGAPVDSVISNLLPHLDKGDVIIDGGNSFFKDTERRSKELAEKGIHFLGVGVSGGESGARNGPSMMPGGELEAYELVRPIFEAVAAKVNGEPCVSHLGLGAAGHYVKMVHNGIEYGLMQLIAETYDLMKKGLHLDNGELHNVYKRWNEGELRSFLLEITAQVFLQQDDKTSHSLIDMILDSAGQKGTGGWTSEEAMVLQIPIPTIDVAVAMRNLSAYKEDRETIAGYAKPINPRSDEERNVFLNRLQNAYHAAALLTYAQGMALLHAASKTYDYKVDLEKVARIWRGGCIIRADLLEKIRSAFRDQPDLPNLLLSPDFFREVQSHISDLRGVVSVAALFGIPAPTLMISLGYFDAYRSARLPANLLQAQRDLFGAHTYQRIDQEGIFHTNWNQK
ncbi:MAG: NADP-dependent phosphogluconate dehydrogenase [bacterium]|nr:NADP-dependent phosphogluconate dehydrogenase [bacterium]